MFDVFYLTKPLGIFAHEKKANSIEHASVLSETRYFWIVHYLCDYREFDFLWEPPPWQSHQRHAWCSQWQPDSGTYLIPRSGYTDTNYHPDPVIFRIPNTDLWIVPDNIDRARFDWSWHPDPNEPDFEFHFGTQWQRAGGPIFPGSAGIKLCDQQRATAMTNDQHWSIPDWIDADSVDRTWHPDPLDPPYIYHFPSQHQPVSGVMYTVPGATEIKIMTEPRVRSLSVQDRWHTPSNIAGFDYTWHPNPLDPPYVHEFGTQWYDEGGPVYAMPRALERKYHTVPRAVLAAGTENWHRLHDIDEDSFDWSWRPHPRDPAYIYVWGNQHWPAEKMPTLEYRVPGATERKYMPSGPRLLPCHENWVTPDDVDQTTVDYTWRPDPGDPAYVYEFATQWQNTGGACYVVPGAQERKYIGMTHLRRSTQDHHWEILEDIDDFDFSWHPDSREPPYIYVFGNQHYPGTIMPTVKYTAPGATQEKFVEQPVARLRTCRHHWEVCEPIDKDLWDWSWRPNPTEPPYVYVFGNQWNAPELKASVIYRVPGAQEIKHMDRRTRRLPQPGLFRQVLSVVDFDYSWEPNPFDPPMTYVFGNQWNVAVLEPTVIFDTGGREIKYMDAPVATLAPDTTSWQLLDDIEYFDYSWRPDPTDPPYIYVFGNQWLSPETKPALMYSVKEATDIKYIGEPRARRTPRPQDFVTHHPCEFDYSWEPDPGSPPYIYVFGNQHWPAEKMPTVEYHVLGATERKFVDEPCARLVPTDENWHTTTDHEFEFDRSWCPDPGDPPYIYVFGNQWHPAEKMSTIEYHVPGAREKKFLDQPRALILPNRDRWTVPEEVDAEAIDFSWIPDPGDPAYVYHFGSEYQTSVGLTYTVPGAVNVKFAGEIPQKSTDKKAISVLDIFYMDRSNVMSSARFERLKEKYPHMVKIRYANSVMDTIRRCLDKTKHSKFWVIGSENIYDDFDFAWHAQPWQNSMTHVFGSQWNKWSDTFLINRWEFERHAKWAMGIEQFPNLNFVQDQKTTAPADACDIYMIDFDNVESPQTLDFLRNRYRVVKTARYFDNYLDTLRRLLQDVESEHIWVVGSVCDYTRFDFSWQPEAWQRDMLHVFPSNDQKFGDTFYVPVRALQEKINTLELLDWFDTVNYCDDQKVDRWPMPVIVSDQDTHVDAVKHSSFPGPLAVFSVTYPGTKKMPTVSLWREKTKTIIPLSNGAGTVIVPKSAIPHIKTQLYDYPYIDKTQKSSMKDRELDIVFISNGEPNAEENWEILNSSVMGWSNRVHRVDGVTGRAAAYQAAARASATPWFFAVFAKLEINPDFDWTWQPDRMQQPKHYIFHARNPVNGLVYGHQAMIAYNRHMVMNNTGRGLDFTLDQPHEVVPLMSGTAWYAETAWMAWRTAFREVIKLRHSLPDVENGYRLDQWLNHGQGEFGVWSQHGAQDALEYYDSVSGELDQLRKSYEWAWLASYALERRNLAPDR